jgi:peptidoglycan/LPS O-acetylase OafA/YrhL
MNTRLHTLDYLRGLSALGIMVYHYLFWLNGSFTSDQFMGRVGVYGVAIFYVLSGLTLYHVYEYSQVSTGFSIGNFFKKRIFRIFPLLWLVTLGAIVLSRKMPNLPDVFLNLTGLFGFVRWHVYFATGAWSIGNELVFYSKFPLILLICMRKPWILLVALALTGLLHHLFAFEFLDAQKPLADQWHTYVNPLNQIFFFVAGCAIGYWTKARSFQPLSATVLVGLGLLLLAWIPAEGNTISIVTDYNRWLFTSACMLICLGAYKLSVRLPGSLHTVFKMLGEGSYSLYLLHPLVFTVWAFIFHWLEQSNHMLPWAVKLLTPIAITLVLSYFVYEYFEKYFMRLGRQSSPGKPS